MSPLAILPSALENSVGALIASFRSSIPCPPMPLFYASLAVSRQQQRQTRGRAARYSFLVGLFHPLLRTGLSRRSLRRFLHVCQRSVSKSYTCFWCRAHDRRRLLHFNVTAHPTAEWTGQQLREAFPFDQLPRYLLRDRDAIFGNHFREQVRDLGISEVLSAPRSPWQRAYRERVIGTIRRECLDHVIVFHENALRRTLHSYFDYYHRSRTHLRWGRTHRSHERFSRRKWDRSWRYRRSGDCTTATNDGPPKEPKSSVLRVASARTLDICLRTVLRCTRVPARISFTRLEQVHELLEPVWLEE